MKFPTFFILGAQKAGTTWLHANLFQHPELGFGSKKELHFFDSKSKLALGADWYAEKFAHNSNVRHIGESTPKYLRMVLPEVYQNDSTVPSDAVLHLKNLCPDSKFIVILRDPIQRALSTHFIRIKNRKRIYWRSILNVPAAADMLIPGKYAEQLEIWFEHFSKENFLILFYEECMTSDEQRAETIRKVCEFLEVSTDFHPVNLHERRNARSTDFEILIGKSFGRFTKQLEKLPDWFKNLPFWKIKISDADMQYMHEYFVEPNQHLAKLLGRDLPWK